MRRSHHLVDIAGLAQAERAKVCSRVLGALQTTVTRFETDVPWADRDEWPDSVRAAAERLVVASGKTVDGRSYQATGVLERSDGEVWAAFCAFAGYAYDASAWSSSGGGPVVSLDDAGTAVVVDVDEALRRSVEGAVHPVRLVPLSEVRRRWFRRRT